MSAINKQPCADIHKNKFLIVNYLLKLHLLIEITHIFIFTDRPGVVDPATIKTLLVGTDAQW